MNKTQSLITKALLTASTIVAASTDSEAQIDNYFRVGADIGVQSYLSQSHTKHRPFFLGAHATMDKIAGTPFGVDVNARAYLLGNETNGGYDFDNSRTKITTSTTSLNVSARAGHILQSRDLRTLYVVGAFAGNQFHMVGKSPDHPSGIQSVPNFGVYFGGSGRNVSVDFKLSYEMQKLALAAANLPNNGMAIGPGKANNGIGGEVTIGWNFWNRHRDRSSNCSPY